MAKRTPLPTLEKKRMNTASRINLSPLPAEPAAPPPPSEVGEVAILTADNQLIVPAAILAGFPGVDCFAVARDGERIILTPLQPPPMETVWAQTAAQGVTEQVVADAVKWARGQNARLPAAG